MTTIQKQVKTYTFGQKIKPFFKGLMVGEPLVEIARYGLQSKKCSLTTDEIEKYQSKIAGFGTETPLHKCLSSSKKHYISSLIFSAFSGYFVVEPFIELVHKLNNKPVNPALLAGVITAVSGILAFSTGIISIHLRDNVLTKANRNKLANIELSKPLNPTIAFGLGLLANIAIHVSLQLNNLADKLKFGGVCVVVSLVISYVSTKEAVSLLREKLPEKFKEPVVDINKSQHNG